MAFRRTLVVQKIMGEELTPENYRLITFLAITFKLFTRITANLWSASLNDNTIFLMEQKEICKDSCGMES